MGYHLLLSAPARSDLGGAPAEIPPGGRDSRCWKAGPLSLTSVRVTVTVVLEENAPLRPSMSFTCTTTRCWSRASRSMLGQDVTMIPAHRWDLLGYQRELLEDPEEV